MMGMQSHEDVAVSLDGVDSERLGENLKKPSPIIIVLEDVLTFVAPAGHVIDCTGVFYAKRTGHGVRLS